MQVFAHHQLIAAGGVACEGHAGRGIFAHIAEDHGLDIDSGAKVVGNIFLAAVVNRAFSIPGLKHGFGGELELLVNILGEIKAEAF